MKPTLNNIPKITIITPSYNQGQFLEETIQSVLGQCYPNLEYIIMDGGSTDNSVDIIKKYEKHLSFWISEKDGGQSAAINAGFSRATGDIFGWLNSDDVYLPGTFQFVSKSLGLTASEIMFGNCLHLQENSQSVLGSDVVKQHQEVDLSVHDYIIQPSAFWTKQIWERVGTLDEGLTYTFDWDWFLRARQLNMRFMPVSKYLSIYRIHATHKTGTGGDKRQAEVANIYEKYAGTNYKDLYLECCRVGDEVHDFTDSLSRIRLHRLSPAILRYKYPKIFHKKNAEVIWAMMGMR